MTTQFESLMEGNRRWAQRAPMLVLGVAQSSYSKKPLETMVFTEEWGKPSRLVDAHNSLINDPPSKN